MKRKVTDKDMKRCLKKWLLKLQRVYNQGYSINTDCAITCPSCGHDTVSFNQFKKGWCCSNPTCKFVFPERLTPPSLVQIQEYFRRQERDRVEKQIDSILNS